MSDFTQLGNCIVHLREEAYHAYAPLVADLCSKEEATENEVGLMLDYLLMYCGNPKVLGLYKQVCRTFYNKYPECIVQYIQWYREEYEADEQVG